MNYVIALLMTAISFGQVVPIKSESRPSVPTDSRPSAWITEQAARLVDHANSTNKAKNESLHLYLTEPSGSYQEKREYFKNRSDSFRTMIAEMVRYGNVISEIEAGVAADKDNTYGWTSVGSGVAIKLLPGWYSKSQTTRTALLRSSQIDADMMKFFDDACFGKFTQPILVRVDRARVDAFKIILGFTDKFDDAIATCEIRRDSVKAETELAVMAILSEKESNRVAEKLEARMSGRGFDIPFNVISAEIIPRIESSK